MQNLIDEIDKQHKINEQMILSLYYQDIFMKEELTSALDQLKLIRDGLYKHAGDLKIQRDELMKVK
jgi:hypothetical protein